MATHTDTQAVVDFVTAYINEHGYSPTLQEIAVGVGLRAKSAAHFHVRRAIKAGDLVVRPHTGRTVRPTRRPNPC